MVDGVKDKPRGTAQKGPIHENQWIAHWDGHHYDLQAQIVEVDEESARALVRDYNADQGRWVSTARLFSDIQAQIPDGRRLIDPKKIGGMNPEDLGRSFDFQPGQRIAETGQAFFNLLGEIQAVEQRGEESWVKIRWGRGKRAQEKWVRAEDLTAKILINRRNRWKLLQAEKDVEVKLPEALRPEERIAALEALQVELEKLIDPKARREAVLTENLAALRELKAELQKALEDWYRASWKESEDKFSTFGKSVLNWLGGRDFLDPSAYVDKAEYQARRAEIGAVEEKTVLFEKALQGKLPAADWQEDPLLARLALEAEKGVLAFSDHVDLIPKPNSDEETLAYYAQVQAEYLHFHPEASRSELFERINTMIERGVLKTPLAMIATAADLEAILPDIEAYNRDLGAGIHRSAGFGYLDIHQVHSEIARLMSPEENYPENISLIRSAQEKALPIVEGLRRNPNLRLTYAAGDAARLGWHVGGAVLKGAAELADDPGLALMLVTGVGVAGPLSRSLIARLIAAGVSERRARLMGLAFNGMLFHTAKSTMELGLDRLPGVDRSQHVDFSAAGNLHAIAIMGWLGKMQQVYGQTVQGTLKFLQARPALQKTLDVLGSKTFETIGLASFNLGIGTAAHGVEALSPDNIYRELIDSARFAIAYGAMHAGQHPKTSPGRQAFELARKNLLAEAAKQAETGRPDPARLKELNGIVRNAFEVMQKEQKEGLERELRLGRTNLKRVASLLSGQQRLLRQQIGRLEAARTQDSANENYYTLLIENLQQQIEVLGIFEKEMKERPIAALKDEIERRAEKLKDGERPQRTFEKAASRKRRPHRNPARVEAGGIGDGPAGKRPTPSLAEIRSDLKVLLERNRGRVGGFHGVEEMSPAEVIQYFQHIFGEDWPKVAFLFSNTPESLARIEAMRKTVAERIAGKNPRDINEMLAEVREVFGEIEAVLDAKVKEFLSASSGNDLHPEYFPFIARRGLLTDLYLQLLPDDIPVYRSVRAEFAGEANRHGESHWGVGADGLRTAGNYQRANPGEVLIESTLGDLRRAGTLQADPNKGVVLYHTHPSAENKTTEAWTPVRHRRVENQTPSSPSGVTAEPPARVEAGSIGDGSSPSWDINGLIQKLLADSPEYRAHPDSVSYAPIRNAGPEWAEEVLFSLLDSETVAVRNRITFEGMEGEEKPMDWNKVSEATLQWAQAVLEACETTQRERSDILQQVPNWSQRMKYLQALLRARNIPRLGGGSGDPISVRRGAVSETLSFELENTDVVLPWNIGTGPTVLGRADGIQLSLMVTEHPKQRGVLEGKVFVNGGAVGVLSILIQPDGTLRFDLVESLLPAMSGKQILLSKDQIVGALRRWEQAHNEVVQTKNREGSAPARRDPESGMANIQGPFGDLVELIVAGARKLFGRRAAQTKAEPAPSSRPPLPRNIVEGIEGLIFGTRWQKKAESPALPAALKQRDPIGLLMALAEHPDVAWLPEREIREGDENLRVVAEVQRRSPEFHHLLAELVRLGLEQIETGDRRVTEDRLKALAGRAGLSQAGKHKDPRLPSRRQRLEARLARFGFHRHGDWPTTLKTVLENPKYVMEPAGTDHAMVKLDPLYEELVSDLVSQIEMIRTRGGRENLMGVQMELAPLLNPHGFDSSGRRIRFPKTKAFFERHLPDQKFEPNRPEDMLSMLAYPDADWHGTKIDAVGKEGWAEAVRELAEAVIPEYLEKPKIGRMGRPWFAFGEIPRLQLTPIVDRELARLLEGSREAIEARLERWKQEGANGSQGADQTGEDRGTQFMAYHRGVRGGRSSDLFGKIEQGERGFEWLAHHALKGAIGRFYIGVRAEHAEAFRKAFQEEVLNPALKEGLKFSAKIANDPRRLEAAGDATVVYFQARDQRIFYAQLATFIRHHEGKGWFHTLEMDRRPILAAQILDPEGRPVAGLSFGQEVPGGYQSFNELRANAVTRALRNERLLDALGLLGDLNAEGREALRKNLILWELQRAGVDIENPAFQRDGMKIFGDIFEHTDQGFAQSGQTPPRGTKAEVPSPASSPAGAADFRRARLLNERILTGDAAAVLEAKAYYHQETESMGVNAGPMRIAINAYVDPQSGLITAVGNTQEIPSEIRQRSAGVTFTVVQLFADLSLIQAVEAAGVRLRFGDRVSVVSLEEGAQEKLLSLVEDLGRRAKVSPKIMIQVRRAIEESRTDPSRLEPVFNGMIEKVALAKGMTPEAQGILQGLRGLAFFSVRDRSGAGWRVLDGREVKPPEVADLARQLLDSVENEALKKTMERQWQSVWRERCKSGEDLGGWLADVFGQFYMTLEAFGSRGDQPEVVAPVRELVGIIETVRAQGIEVKIAERIWEKTVQIINRNKPEAGNQAALAHLPSDFAQKIYEGVRDPELRRVMEVQWPKKELTNERVSLTNGRLGGWLRDVFGHIATQTMHGEGEDQTKAVAAMTELIPIIERVLSEGITLPLWDPALLEEAKRIVAGGS